MENDRWTFEVVVDDDEVVVDDGDTKTDGRDEDEDEDDDDNEDDDDDDDLEGVRRCASEEEGMRMGECLGEE